MATGVLDMYGSSDFRTSELDFAEMACDAAIQIDRALSGKTIRTEPISRLAGVIPDSLRAKPKSGSGSTYLFDPTGVLILNRAFAEANPSGGASNIGELITEAEHISDSLAEVATSFSQGVTPPPRETLESLRGFCLNLARAAAATEQSITDSQPNEIWG